LTRVQRELHEKLSKGKSTPSLKPSQEQVVQPSSIEQLSGLLSSLNLTIVHADTVSHQKGAAGALQQPVSLASITSEPIRLAVCN
jgi:hypothetical protein